MDVVLWIIASLVAMAFLAAGVLKLARSKEHLIGAGMGWAEAYPPAGVKAIGALEVAGAIGLTLPPLLSIAPVLAPLAASGLALLMVGAVITHARRGEYREAVPSVVLLVLAAVVAVARFGPYAF